MNLQRRDSASSSSRKSGKRPIFWITGAIVMVALLIIAGYGVQNAQAHILYPTGTTSTTGKQLPVVVTVFSPGMGDKAGSEGAGNVIDLSLDAATPADNAFLSASKGYKPFFNAPGSATFHPGFDPGAPGLVVLLSTTKTIPGTAFQGPGTNLAGLFQINGIASVNNGTINEAWNTWLVGKPIAGSDVHSILTVFVVSGEAPTVIHGNPEHVPGRISNIVQVPFTIA
jgi:hypothetical protein